MSIELQILLAFALDLMVGDPRWFPHPVRAIGWLARRLEPLTRRLVPHARLAGMLTAALVIGLTGAASWAALLGARHVSPWAADGLGVVLLWTTLAARDLAVHGARVRRRLAAGDLEQARRSVAMMVGRDTQRLDASEVARAAVESVAENTVDGVTAPLLFAAVAGPVGALAYKAVNTLDSTFGYRNERYLAFGWASARIDDAANWVPARLTAVAICVAAWLLRFRAGGAWRIVRRDARNHTSPNAGFSEAAFAGALGVRLGGLSHYGGQPSRKPFIGEPAAPLGHATIRDANRLMLLTSVVFTAAAVGARAGVVAAIARCV